MYSLATPRDPRDLVHLMMIRHGISWKHGFLGFFEPPWKGPDILLPFFELGACMPEVLAQGKDVFEGEIKRLPLLSDRDCQCLSKYHSNEQITRSAVSLSFEVQAWVHQDWRNPRRSIPPQLARPICAIATNLGMPPLLQYQYYTLANWKKIDKEKPIIAENVEMLQHFNSRQFSERFCSEQWFIAIHVDIEASAGPLIEAALLLDWALANKSHELIGDQLFIVTEKLLHMTATLGRMHERCIPEIYYEHVRPYLFGWSVIPGGVTYEGVSEKMYSGPQFFPGQTGAQSSIAPLLDIVLGIAHGKSDKLSKHLDIMLRKHTPTLHRTLLLSLKKQHAMRKKRWAEARKDPFVAEALRKARFALALFRRQHYIHAIVYIGRFAKQEKHAAHVAGAMPKGTGGTDFIASLKKHIEDTLDPSDLPHLNRWEEEWKALYHAPV